MDRPAFAACPCSYSESCSTFRATAGDDPAARTSPGGIGLTDFCENDACVRAFVFQHHSQLAPAGVEHRLGHLGLGKATGRDIAHIDFPAAPDELAREFVQGIGPAVFDFRVEGFDAARVTRPLGHGELRLQVAVEAPGFQRLAIATRRCILQAQIQADGILAFGRLRLGVNNNIEIPAASGILGKAGATEFMLAQTPGVPDLELAAVMKHLAVFP